MGIYKQGILGPFSGKVGTVVGSSWRGTPYLRSLATKVANPRTAKQVQARTRLATVVAGIKHFASLIAQGYLGTGTVSPWSQAIKDNIKFVEKDDSDALRLNFEKVTLSNGSAIFDIKATKAASSVSFSWTAPQLTDDFYGGGLFAGAYNVANGKARTSTAELSAGSLDFDFQSILSGTDDDDVHVYFFVATDKVSTASVHLGD